MRIEPRIWTLAQLRGEFGISQEHLGRELGTSQPAVKKAEGAADPRLSTVRRFVEALGATTGQGAGLEMKAVIGKRTFLLDLTAESSTARQMHSTDRTSRAIGVAWRLRAWDDEALQAAFIARSIIAVSADEIGDVTVEPSRQEYRTRLRSVPALRGRSEQAIGIFVGYWNRFRTQMAIDDIVAVPLAGSRVAIGIVAGEYHYAANEPNPRLRHVRPVHWLATDVPRAELDDDLRKVVNAPGTICSFNQTDAAVRLAEVAEQF